MYMAELKSEKQSAWKRASVNGAKESSAKLGRVSGGGRCRGRAALTCSEVGIILDADVESVELGVGLERKVLDADLGAHDHVLVEHLEDVEVRGLRCIAAHEGAVTEALELGEMASGALHVALESGLEVLVGRIVDYLHEVVCERREDRGTR